MPSAAQYIASKQLLPSELDYKGYTQLSAQTLERAFVMACVSDAKTLDKNKRMAEGILRGDLSPAEAREQLRRYYDSTNYQPEPGEGGTIKDLRTKERMQATLDTNVAMAKGWARKNQLAGNIARPGLELFRAGHAKEPRDWQARWKSARSQVGGKGVAEGDDMIAMPESPIWSAISEFNQPYPPFDWGSHMDIRPVGLKRCIDLGLIADPQSPDPERAKEGKAKLAEIQQEGRESLNHDCRITAKLSVKSLREELATRLEGLAEFDGKTIRLTDPNGTRPYGWKDIGGVITAPNKADIPHLQADALVEWIHDSRRFAPGATKGVKPASAAQKSAMNDLISRISPMDSDEGGSVMRGLKIKDHDAFLSMIKDEGYGARDGFLAESWTGSSVAAHKYAGDNGVVMTCAKYKNRKRIDATYRQLELKMKNPQKPEMLEGESLFSAKSKFNLINSYHRGGTLYVEVEER